MALEFNDDAITVKQAAELLGVTVQRVHQVSNLLGARCACVNHEVTSRGPRKRCARIVVSRARVEMFAKAREQRCAEQLLTDMVFAAQVKS